MPRGAARVPFVSEFHPFTSVFHQEDRAALRVLYPWLVSATCRFHGSGLDYAASALHTQGATHERVQPISVAALQLAGRHRWIGWDTGQRRNCLDQGEGLGVIGTHLTRTQSDGLHLHSTLARPPTGWRIEVLAPETAERLQRAIAIKLVIAWRLMLLTLLGRETPELPLEVLFSDLEIAVLQAYAKKRQMSPPVLLDEAVPLVAQMGGYVGCRLTHLWVTNCCGTATPNSRPHVRVSPSTTMDRACSALVAG